MLDRFDCYELCVQSARHVVALLRGVHANEPLILREDFCGTAAVSRRWCEERQDTRAVAVDLDADTIAKARSLIDPAVAPRLQLLHADALTQPATDPADAVFVGNFSIGYIHSRPALLDYFRASRDRLSRGQNGFGGGILACDTYGGAGAFQIGGIERKHPSHARELIRYTWLHEQADPITAMVTNSISFRIEIDGEVIHELPRAFVYRWRLWSIAELRDAMLEAGFASVDVFKDVNLAPGETPVPVGAGELAGDWIVLVVGRVN
ncbi:hypothetical protein PHYC_01125 [Phycisphaerales bacterium]|nr:hypothetical protein PHYC_01125 [Phycisphaerales bacterium]